MAEEITLCLAWSVPNGQAGRQCHSCWEDFANVMPLHVKAAKEREVEKKQEVAYTALRGFINWEKICMTRDLIRQVTPLQFALSELGWTFFPYFDILQDPRANSVLLHAGCHVLML